MIDLQLCHPWLSSKHRTRWYTRHVAGPSWAAYLDFNSSLAMAPSNREADRLKTWVPKQTRNWVILEIRTHNRRKFKSQTSDFWKIRPHRFGSEGVLIGGQNSNTKCSMTFVNIAVAISALAGGAQKRFRTETRIRWCFRHFSRIFGCLSARGYWNGILGHFGSFPAMEKRPKMKKNIVHSKILQGFWMPEHWKHCKNKCFGLTL